MKKWIVIGAVLVFSITFGIPALVWVVFIPLFILFGFLVLSVLTLEETAQEEVDDIEEICEACMWRDAGNADACKDCMIRVNKD